MKLCHARLPVKDQCADCFNILIILFAICVGRLEAQYGRQYGTVFWKAMPNYYYFYLGFDENVLSMMLKNTDFPLYKVKNITLCN